MKTRRERAKFWIAGDLGGLELLRATYVTHSFSRHTHEGFAIAVIEAGTEAFWYRGATQVAPPGSIALVNPGEPHTGHAAGEEGWSYRVLYPDAALLQRAAGLSGARRDAPFFPEPVIRDPLVAALLVRAHETLERSAPALERESRLLWALSHLVSRHAERRPEIRPAGRERAAVRRAREYLRDRYRENVSLEELSGVANLSPFHLLRVFREEVGLPPHTYLLGVRLRRARALLAAGHPAGRAAAETGFTDQSHLSRHFKRTFGYTPGQYARNSKNLQYLPRSTP